MNDPLQILQSEHREIERRLDRAGRAPDRKQAVADVQSAVLQHVERETSIVYAKLEAAATDSERLISSMRALADAGSDGDFDAAVAELRAAIVEHRDTVERDLLPALHARLGETDYLAVGDALIRARHPSGVDAV